MAAAWCAGAATASFDIVFEKRGALKADIDYTLRDFDTSVENFEYVAKVRTCYFVKPWTYAVGCFHKPSYCNY